MQTFLEETLHILQSKYQDISSLTIILPSKRAGGFLRNYLRKQTSLTAFAPKVISIEEFIEEISGLKIIDTTELLFKSYETYNSIESISEKEDFETYVNWATTLINDFNEIDRYLIPQEQFFTYLSSIQDINHWYVKEEKTKLITEYLKFWYQLPEIYKSLKETLLNDGLGYQGMVYREAVDSMEHYIAAKGNISHVFIGFNALNKAEQYIIQALLETGNTEVFWDSDTYFYQDTHHSASLFLRKYMTEWKYFSTKTPSSFPSNFEKPKKFQIVEAQKNIAQAKYVGSLLAKFSDEELNKTAIVLADENLLLPILYALPKNVSSVNITMGVTLKTFPATNFFESLLNLHKNNPKTLFYKDVLALLNHPLGTTLIDNAPKIVSTINSENSTYISISKLIEFSEQKNEQLLTQVFGSWENNGKNVLEVCSKLLLILKEKYNENPIERVVLYHLYTVFKKIEALQQKYTHLKTINTVLKLFTELITTTTLDFEGDAYKGLQIMGVLETRVLDFKNVIITSVNEGILPSGKANNSFITYDLKQQFSLPSYTEKDAIYTYHFYHLLHRAENITLLYNSHTEGLNSGEKSRFLLQLEIESHPNHSLEKVVLTPTVSLQKKELRTVVKTPAVQERLREIAGKSFSPSSLTNYMRNPMDFYYQKILKINEYNDVEETVAYNTLGTIVHDTLQHFYEPLEGSFLSAETIQKIKPNIEEQVRIQFKRTFKGGDFTKGKNLIIFEVIKRYVYNLLQYDLAEIEAGNKIKIIKIEKDLKLKIDITELDFPVFIGGKVDRVDEYNGQLRIIDYKTGFVKQSDLEIMEWEEITQDYKYSKVVQVLAYALMINKDIPNENAEAGIISFKNLNSGFLKFGIKNSVYDKNKQQQITQEILNDYTMELKKLILEICNPEIPFTQKEIN